MRFTKTAFMAIGLAIAVLAVQPGTRSDAVESAVITKTSAGVPGLDMNQPKAFETATFGLG